MITGKPPWKIFRFVALFSLLINSYFLYANWEAVSSNGTGFSLFISSLFPGVLLVLSFLATIVFALFGLFARIPRRYFITATAMFVYFSIGIIMSQIGQWIRIKGFEAMAERSIPLTSAIERYQLVEGFPSQTLSDLVPHYLTAIPGTGIGATPEYQYYAGGEARNYDNNPWVLVVPAPSEGIGFDQFLYFPKQNYPERGYGGWLEPVGRWAYVHE